MDSFRQISRDVTSGAVTSVISLVYSLSFAALIFSGDTAGGYAQGISALLIGTGVTALAAALFSAFRFAVSGPDSNACAVMATMAVAIAGSLGARATPEVAVDTVFYLLALTTLITGACLAALGLLRAGRWIRFIPYPVVGGLIAAAGAYTVLGACRVVGGTPITVGTLDALALPQLQAQLLAGVAWAVLLAALLRWWRSPVALPVAQILGVLVFHLGLLAAGGSVDDARAQGWLVATAVDARPWTPWHAEAFARTEWSLLLRHAGDIGTLVLVTTLTVLINATGLEMETRTDADLDRELTVQGGANVVAPFAGGLLGYLSMNRSLMNYQLGATSRISGLAFAAVSIALAWSGLGLIGYLPRPLLGGLLFYFGYLLLRKWAVDSRLQLPLGDYLTLLTILAVTLVSGFGHGLLLGILAGCVMFVVTYSKVRVVKFSFSGREFRSGHERSAEDKALLAAHGDEIRIFVLQGFIFFGMADQLYRAVLAATAPASGPRARFVVLDLALVHGIDASAIASFKKIAYNVSAGGGHLVMSGLGESQAAEWQAGGDPDLQKVRYFADLDAGVEWCEGALIVAHRGAVPGGAARVEDWLRAEMGGCADTLLGYLERRSLAAGERLCSAGDAADEMFFIESGRVSVEVAHGGDTRRLRTLGAKTILGEMGLYRAVRRSADIVAQEPVVAYRLGSDALREIEAAHPQVAARFHAMVVKAVADRLEFSNALVTALQR